VILSLFFRSSWSGEGGQWGRGKEEDGELAYFRTDVDAVLEGVGGVDDAGGVGHVEKAGV